jgi:hypothetical protein
MESGVMRREKKAAAVCRSDGGWPGFLARVCGLSVLLAGLGGCVTAMKEFPVQEQFGSATTYSRVFDATPGQTCEAARRALLSQGYLISVSSEELIQGRKSFQPDQESHMAMEIRFVCAANGTDGKSSLGFVTALQDLYNLKKSNNSASLGVGVLGSVSLPFSSSNDSMVRVTSQTIASESFYDRFFELVRRYLANDEASTKAR